MSYTNDIPNELLSDYEEILDWVAYFNKEQETHNPLIRITNKIFRCEVVFLASTYDFEIIFDHCCFLESLSFGQCTFNKQVSIFNCYVDNSICTMLRPVIFNEDFIISNTKAKNLAIMDGQFNNCTWIIPECDKVLLGGQDFKNLDLIIEEAREIDIYLNRLNGIIKIIGNGKSVGQIKIEGIPKDVSLSIEDLKVGKFEINKYRNEGSFRLININPIGNESSFIIRDSYMGKAEFNSVDFSKFILTLADTHLVECTFNNVVWPTSLNQYLSALASVENKKIYYSKGRETFRQLKFAMSKQGDVINEQKFHSLEMRAYNKVLEWSNDFWTKSIINMSYWLSDFGQSVSKPLIGLLAGHFILFSILTSFNFFEEFHVSINTFSNKAFWNGFNTYFVLISPIRKIGDTTFYGGWILIDILMRVWSSYMIYNIIRATRRLIK